MSLPLSQGGAALPSVTSIIVTLPIPGGRMWQEAAVVEAVAHLAHLGGTIWVTKVGGGGGRSGGHGRWQYVSPCGGPLLDYYC